MVPKEIIKIEILFQNTYAQVDLMERRYYATAENVRTRGFLVLFPKLQQFWVCPHDVTLATCIMDESRTSWVRIFYKIIWRRCQATRLGPEFTHYTGDHVGT
jgi:hypothetical protein